MCEEVGMENFNTNLIALTSKVKVGKTMTEFFYWLNKVARLRGV